MSITADLIRGHTDAIILAHLLERDSYGYEINKAILEQTEHRYELKEATLYTAFRRLEDAGYIASYWGNETVGARRKYYTLTQAGRSAFEEQQTAWKNARDMINKLMKTEEHLI
ncbi:MAG: helix-turn-helix transcriptional regulator [Ruminococcaceae bacterium]|nr:helix-turn-helix transcriptional regulator [Oscillospiraceae bacterium]